MGAAATLLLHSLFFAAAMWGGGSMPRHPDRPDAIGAGANLGRPEGDSSERRITIRLLSDIAAKPSPTTPDAHLAAPVRQSLLDISGPDALPLPPLLIDEDGIPAENSDAELMARTKMAGIYESQIRARIERAWTLPEEIFDEQTFKCTVLIRQKRDGRISEVEMPQECGGSPAMRQSLIGAIFTASPLPAPPHPGVFVDSFSLMLHSE
ncbi:MAG TPA: TonB C-terminal domain-containing protein, partial [Steroidobacteraceae bacterium]|nr:TonB C-terminal domain-containing protein [Steroidobacteraceae bacterium]